ncbi:unnamed protein product [Lepeophtheirus salmonis]|uniref:(salmon louse) hypothetical protein n=1 Tax=Lepeophtheirus salmonis TaxID=72036 RepID=A0A7R8CXL2_LEPSM|nr:unnamed protein product [Lepeophtheirus salmonis]CAF2961085.1 unnamed protein product [Lepeophtheirus salmonis]
MDRNKAEEDYSDVEEPKHIYSDSEIEDPYYRRHIHSYTNSIDSVNEVISLQRRSLFHNEAANEKGSNHSIEMVTQKEGIDYKKNSLFSMGIPTSQERNIEIKNRSDEMLEMAVRKLRTADWRSQIQGMETIVQLSSVSESVVSHNLIPILSSLMNFSKNLRSQLCRTAIQSLTYLFLNLGQLMEVNKLEDVADALLLKSSDTNKFIRSDAKDALEAMLNNISIYKVTNILCRLSSLHKSSMSRSVAAKLLADLVQQLGHERMFESSSNKTNHEILEAIISSGAQFFLEGKPRDSNGRETFVF